jgi:outer membrane protein OmpA-like peptidoglycan-associated protein
MAFTPDGQEMLGLWWDEGRTDEVGGTWVGTKTSASVGTCPHWSGGARQQLEKDLEGLGRARIYGINFDTDSDKIRDESKPTLDRIAALLKAKPDWKLSIEGHTDATATAQHNQQLSERRAAAVKVHLVAAGIDATRLSAKGLGATKPAASNATAMGRAQNRRVELVKL